MLSTETQSVWRPFFRNWPESIPCDGFVVTTYGDSIPFCNILTSEDLMLIDRPRPDANGARRVILEFSAIAAVNLKSNAPVSQFQCMGFQPPL